MSTRVIRKKVLFFIMGMTLLSIVFAFAHQAEATGEPYTIDMTDTTPPSFDDYEVVKVSTLADLSGPLSSTNTTKIVFELQNDLTITSRMLVNGDKAINLNGHTLTATNSAYLVLSNVSTTNQFKLYNGTISGGPNVTNAGGLDGTSYAFLNVDYRKMADIVFEDLTYNSLSTGGNFFIGLAANIFSLGTVNVTTFCQNIRAANMTFLGDFNGLSFGNGNQDDYGQGNGGLNLSFNGYNYSFRNSFSSYGKQTMSQTSGDKRIYIGKDSHVVLKNTNTGNVDYGNNIGNFSTITVNGSLEAEAVGASLRTTASSSNNSVAYKNQAGTYNGQANINVNEGAIFKVSSTSTSSTTGTLYTYNTDVHAYKPVTFDMRYYGTGNFFYSYQSSPNSNFYLFEQNIGVWAKSSKGIGNPLSIWQDVETMSLRNFYVGSSANNVTSSDPTLNASTFTINNYSRISNDVSLPKVVPDAEFVDASKAVFLNNGSNTFSGTTDYYIKDKLQVGEVAADASVTLKITGGDTYTTQTDAAGNWTFGNLDLSKVKGGTTATLDLTDADQRTATQVKITIKDTLPPVATPKLIKVALGDSGGLVDPKQGVDIFSDETTANGNIKFTFVTSEDDRKSMISSLGVYSVDIEVSDEAGNSVIVTAPVLVYPPGETITDGYVTGNDFKIDYNTWNNATDAERRSFVIAEEYGGVQGYAVNGNTVTDVSADPAKMIVTSGTSVWNPNTSYPITIKVNSYTKVINVTLVPNEVKMQIKQIYKGSDDQPIYSDLETKKTVTNTSVYEETVGEDIVSIITDIATSGEFTLNYDGYTNLSYSDYKIIQNGKEVTPKPETIPKEDFTIVYEYTGQMKFQEVAEKIDFGVVELSGEETTTPLSNTSDNSLAIINTLENSTWKLTAALPEGLTRVDDNSKSFIGSIVYKDSTGKESTIGTDGTMIEMQKSSDLLSKLNLKEDTSGMYLRQESGNLKGSYSGKLVWTLTDAP